MENSMNVCVFGESGSGKTTVIEALQAVAKDRFYTGPFFSFTEINDPIDEDVLAGADVAVLVLDATGIGVTEQDEEVIGIAEELNVPHISVFINKVDLSDEMEILDLFSVDACEKLSEYGFYEPFIACGSAAGAVEDPRGRWGDKVMEFLTFINESRGE